VQITTSTHIPSIAHVWPGRCEGSALGGKGWYSLVQSTQLLHGIALTIPEYCNVTVHPERAWFGGRWLDGHAPNASLPGHLAAYSIRLILQANIHCYYTRKTQINPPGRTYAGLGLEECRWTKGRASTLLARTGLLERFSQKLRRAEAQCRMWPWLSQDPSQRNAAAATWCLISSDSPK
jgi:hypothetical protein